MKLGKPSLYWLWRQNRREGRTVYMAFHKGELVTGELTEGKLAQALYQSERDPEYKVRPVRIVPMEKWMVK